MPLPCHQRKKSNWECHHEERKEEEKQQVRSPNESSSKSRAGTQLYEEQCLLYKVPLT